MASNTTPFVMGRAIDEVLDIVYRATERPRQTVTAAAVAINDTSFNVDAGSAERIVATDVVEFGRERMLVTGVSGATLTVSRGYSGTTAAALGSGATGSVNPSYPRDDVDRSLRRCFNLLEAHLPFIASETVYPEATNLALRSIDSSVMRVLRVEHWSGADLSPLKGFWEFKDWVPEEISYTGKALALPPSYRNEPVVVTYQTPYAWSGVGDAATVDMVVGADDLPVEFAVARLQTGREVSRQEFDQIEEWSQVEASRRGQNIRMLQTLWGRFFQRLDEARSTQNMPKTMTYGRLHARIR